MSLCWGKLTWALDTCCCDDDMLDRWGLLPTPASRPPRSSSDWTPACSWLGLLPRVRPLVWTRVRESINDVNLKRHLPLVWRMAEEVVMQGSAHLTRVYKSMVTQTLAQDRRIRLARLKGFPCPPRKDIFPHWKHSKVFFPPSTRHNLDAVNFWNSPEAAGPGGLTAKMERYAIRRGRFNTATNKDWETRVLMLEDNFGRVSVSAMAPRPPPTIAPRPPYCHPTDLLLLCDTGSTGDSQM